MYGNTVIIFCCQYLYFKFSEISAMCDIDNILQYPAVYEQTHQVSILYCSLHVNLCVDRW